MSAIQEAVIRAESAAVALLADPRDEYVYGAADVFEALADYVETHDEGPVSAAMATLDGRSEAYRSGAEAACTVMLELLAAVRVARGEAA